MTAANPGLTLTAAGEPGLDRRLNQHLLEHGADLPVRGLQVPLD
jgi:hypothetical protein